MVTVNLSKNGTYQADEECLKISKSHLTKQRREVGGLRRQKTAKRGQDDLLAESVTVSEAHHGCESCFTPTTDGLHSHSSEVIGRHALVNIQGG